MARQYANENFPLPVVEELRWLGHDVLTIQEIGQAGQAASDTAVLEFACAHRRTWLTFNRKHFVHLQLTDHSGIIVCSFDRDSSGLAHRIHEAIDEQPQISGLLIRINRKP